MMVHTFQECKNKSARGMTASKGVLDFRESGVSCQYSGAEGVSAGIGYFSHFAARAQL